jgi:hypothetical protein
MSRKARRRITNEYPPYKRDGIPRAEVKVEAKGEAEG